MWQPSVDWVRAGSELLWSSCLTRRSRGMNVGGRRLSSVVDAQTARYARQEVLPLWVKPQAGRRFDAPAILPPTVAAEGGQPVVWLSQVPNTIRAIVVAHRAPSLPSSFLPWTRAEGAAMAAALAVCSLHGDRRRARTADDPTISGRMSMAALASLADSIAQLPAASKGGSSRRRSRGEALRRASAAVGNNRRQSGGWAAQDDELPAGRRPWLHWSRCAAPIGLEARRYESESAAAR